MNKFKQIFEKILQEDITAAGVGMGSTNPILGQSNDFYAPGDARIPKILGKIQRRKLARRKNTQKFIPSKTSTI